MIGKRYSPARRGDVLELPAPALGDAKRVTLDTGRRRREVAALVLGTGLALLSAFIPMTARAADIYISGGGGGSSATMSAIAYGGAYAGAGTTYNGGGAYVGDRSGTSNLADGSTSNQTGKVGFTGVPPGSYPGDPPGKPSVDGPSGAKGGDASFEVTGDLSGYDIQVQSGNSGNYGAGGEASLIVSGELATGKLDVIYGSRIQSSSTYGAGKVSAYVGTLRVDDDTVVNLDGTTEWDGTTGKGAAVNGLAFTGGSTLTVTSAKSGTMIFAGDLSVDGKGNELISPILFDASGGILTFNLAEESANSAMLTVSGDTKIRGAKVSMNFNGVPPDQTEGSVIKLIETDAGTLTGEPVNAKTLVKAGNDIYIYGLAANDNNLTATLISVVQIPTPTPTPTPFPKPQPGRGRGGCDSGIFGFGALALAALLRRRKKE